jgi:hypothetical protein
MDLLRQHAIAVKFVEHRPFHHDLAIFNVNQTRVGANVLLFETNQGGFSAVIVAGT